MAVATGVILQSTGGNYRLVFLIAGTAYLLALLVIHLLAPRLEPVGQIEIDAIHSRSLGTIVGFGFVGVVFGSFGGWVAGLISRVTGPHLFEYMMIGALVSAVIGVVAGMLITKSNSGSGGERKAFR